MGRTSRYSRNSWSSMSDSYFSRSSSLMAPTPLWTRPLTGGRVVAGGPSAGWKRPLAGPSRPSGGGNELRTLPGHERFRRPDLSNALEGAAMERRGAEILRCPPVLGGSVPAVRTEPVVGEPAVIPLHRPISRHFGHHRCSSNRSRDGVTLLHGEVGIGQTSDPPAVGDHVVGSRGERSQDAPEEELVRAMQTAPVDPRRHGLAHGDRQRLLADPLEAPFPLKPGEDLRVVQAIEVEVLRKDHGSCDERTGQRAAPRFIGAGDQEEPLVPEAPLQATEVAHVDNHLIRDGGQMITNARPTTLSMGICPRPKRESLEFSRLSPITKRWFGNTFRGPNGRVSFSPCRYGSSSGFPSI